MYLEEHLKNTNGQGEHIHRFLDQFYRYYSGDHRIILHHLVGVRIVERIFGKEFGWIAEQHILDDWGGRMPLNKDDRDFYRPEWAMNINPDVWNDAYIEATKREKELYERV